MVYLFTKWLSVYENGIIPFLGFLFLPRTTLAYMAAMLKTGIQSPSELQGWWLLLFISAIIMDAYCLNGTEVPKQRKPDTNHNEDSVVLAR